MSQDNVHFLVPGSLTTATGGYYYDRRLIEGLRALGWGVVVRSLDPGFPFPGREALAEAADVLTSIASDELVIIDGLALGAMPEVLAKQASRLRLIALIHHPLALETGLEPDVARRLEESERKALRWVRHVIVTSESTRSILERYAVDAACVSVIKPGTDAVPPADPLRSPHPLPWSTWRAPLKCIEGRSNDQMEFGGRRLRAGSGGGARQLLCVATITPRKGHAVLIEALAGLRHLPWQLVCVGSTERSPHTTQALRQQIRGAGLSERVHLLGELASPALEECFAAAELFVLATHYEGYGMAVAEALAHGLPVIATRAGAIAELVVPEAGRVVEPGDCNSLRAALSEVLTNGQLYAALVAGARAARDRLRRWPETSWEAAKILEAVKQATGRPRSAGASSD
ncbi:MAG TPA: glycosyltransferase family 4 protein [Steroidobacteraceae bacterium]